MIPFDRLLARVEAIPAISPAAVDALTALEHPEVDASELERIVRLDPVLTSTFLRVANAACFGPGSVDSLQAAITRLGLRRVRHIITAAALSDVIPPEIPGYRMDARSFWAHCAATALLTEGIYEQLGEPAPPMAFAAALLHDIGRLALGAIVEEFAEDITAQLEDTDRTFEEIEREVIGVDHASIGMRVATAWRLPAGITHAIAEHHEPERAPEPFRRMVEIIHVADLLAYTMGYGIDIGGLRHRVNDAAAEHLQLEDDQLDLVQESTRESIESLVQIAPTSAGG